MAKRMRNSITVIVILAIVALCATFAISRTSAAASNAYAEEITITETSVEAVVEETEATEEVKSESTEATEEVTEETEATTEATESTEATEETQPETQPAETKPAETQPAPTQPKHEHNYSSKVTVEATCENEGVETFTCDCGDTYTKAIAATGHSYTQKIVDATCTENGYTVNTCACGHSFNDNETKATGHDYEVTTVAPTTEAEGYDLHTCKTCGQTYQDNWTDKLVPETEPVEEPTEPEHTCHYHGTVKKAETCTESGITVYTCECGNSYEETIDALGHVFVGESCQRCGEKDPNYVAPVQEGCRTCDGSHEHIEVVVGDYTYVYCEHIEAPFRSADGWVIYYPIRFYF